MYWETKTKEQQHQMEILTKDAVRVDAALKQVDDQVMMVRVFMKFRVGKIIFHCQNYFSFFGL